MSLRLTPPDRHFWCVWAVDGGPSTVRHPDYATAKGEAQRLARANPGVTFAVMASIVTYSKPDLTIEEMDIGRIHIEVRDEEIPF